MFYIYQSSMDSGKGQKRAEKYSESKPGAVIADQKDIKSEMDKVKAKRTKVPTQKEENDKKDKVKQSKCTKQAKQKTTKTEQMKLGSRTISTAKEEEKGSLQQRQINEDINIDSGNKKRRREEIPDITSKDQKKKIDKRGKQKSRKNDDSFDDIYEKLKKQYEKEFGPMPYPTFNLFGPQYQTRQY